MGFNSLSPFSCPSCLLSAAGGKASLSTARVGLSIPPAKTWALCWVSPSQVCPSGTPHPSALPTERAASSPRIPPPRRVSVSNWGSALRHGATPGSAGAGIRAGIAVLKAGEAPHSPGDPPPGRGRPAVGSDGRRHQRAVRDGAADGGQRPRGAAVRSPTLLGGLSHAGTRRDSAPQSAFLPPPDGRAQPKATLRHPEGPKRRTGYGELNGNAGDREVSLKALCSEETASPTSRVPNGSQQLADANVTPKPSVKGSSLGKAAIKPKNFVQKNSMDKKNEKPYDSKAREGQPADKQDGLSVPNGVVSGGAAYITNGFVGKGADNDGSGSESGYTTPKKRKGRRNSAKGCESLNLVQDKAVQQEVGTALKQELESFKPDYSEQKGNRIESTKPVWKYEAGGGGAGRGRPGLSDVQRKNSDAKAGIGGKKFDERPKGKHASPAASKEDSWTLFKPPPVFPVDNSSAKIVPKISYASKVKENLNKAAQPPSASSSSSSSSSSAGEAQPAPAGRLSQVPMSAMKSVTSAGFSNGPLLAGADGAAYPPGAQPLLASAAAAVPPAPADAVPPDVGAAPAAAEQKKSNLFIYPSDMQTALLGTAQVDFPSQANQQNLGDIFQNQWGLSFINEPSAGPEAAAGKSADNPSMEVTFQGEYPAASGSHGAEAVPSGAEQPAFPKAYELDKRTNPSPALSAAPKPGTAGEGGGAAPEPHHPGELQKADAGSQGALVFLSKDYDVENPLASPTNNLLSSAKEQGYQRGLERKDSWGSFDLSAAVKYHTKEMEAVWNLQKQDPKRIITYDEAMDHPDQ